MGLDEQGGWGVVGGVFQAEEQAGLLPGVFAEVVGGQEHHALVQADGVGQVTAGGRAATVEADAGQCRCGGEGGGWGADHRVASWWM